MSARDAEDVVNVAFDQWDQYATRVAAENIKGMTFGTFVRGPHLRHLSRSFQPLQMGEGGLGMIDGASLAGTFGRVEVGPPKRVRFRVCRHHIPQRHLRPLNSTKRGEDLHDLILRDGNKACRTDGPFDVLGALFQHVMEFARCHDCPFICD